MTPEDRAITATYAAKLKALFDESSVKLFTAVQVANPRRAGSDPVWPTPLIISIDYSDILS